MENKGVAFGTYLTSDNTLTHSNGPLLITIVNVTVTALKFSLLKCLNMSFYRFENCKTSVRKKGQKNDFESVTCIVGIEL